MSGIDRQEEIGELKAQFMATLNHEIRTPLTGILGMLDLLLETDLTPEQKDFAESSRICADVLLGVMNSTLEFSALAANQVALEEVEFPVRQLCESVLDEYSPKVRAKGLAFIRNLDLGLPESAIGDPVRIQQILRNLVDNAVKFTAKGEIEFSAGSIVLTDGDVLLSIAIRDTGIGIAKDKVGQIFESFRQLENGLARRFSGMGLGLAVTQKLANLMQAELSVNSNPGQGSTFTINIPLRLPREGKVRLIEASPRNYRVLFLEEHCDSTPLAVRLLHRTRVQVDCAVTPREALDAAGRWHYDLILVDVENERFDPSGTTFRLRALPNCAGTLIYGLTSNCSLGGFETCRRLGLDGFLSKPASSADVLRAVDRFLTFPEKKSSEKLLTMPVAVRSA